MNADPLISLVFVNYQSFGRLSLALQTLYSFEKDNDSFEVIVVNNDEQEQESLKKLAEKFPLRLVSMGGNTGFAVGANAGAAQARGKILGFINPDTEWQSSCLLLIATILKSSVGRRVFGMRLIDEMGKTEAWSRGVAPTLRQLAKDNFCPNWLRWSNSSEESLDWVSGAGLFLEKDFFLELQGFDECFFLYFEDVDLCLRAKEAGAEILSEPQITLRHHGGTSFSSLKKQKKHFYLSQTRYFEKHRPAFEAFCLRLIHRIFHGL